MCDKTENSGEQKSKLSIFFPSSSNWKGMCLSPENGEKQDKKSLDVHDLNTEWQRWTWRRKSITFVIYMESGVLGLLLARKERNCKNRSSKSSLFHQFGYDI